MHTTHVNDANILHKNLMATFFNMAPMCFHFIPSSKSKLQNSNAHSKLHVICMQHVGITSLKQLLNEFQNTNLNNFIGQYFFFTPRHKPMRSLQYWNVNLSKLTPQKKIQGSYINIQMVIYIFFSPLGTILFHRP